MLESFKARPSVPLGMCAKCLRVKSLRVASPGDPAYGRHITTEECSPCWSCWVQWMSIWPCWPQGWWWSGWQSWLMVAVQS